jgi:hypothetical protein
MPTGKHWIQRVILPLGIAAFAALMCAGPGTLLVPFTAQLAAPLICPPGTTLQHSEHPGTDSQGEPVTYVNENCVGDDHVSQAAEGRIFGVLGGIYFVVFGSVALTARFAFKAAARRERPVKPLGVEGLRQVQATLSHGQKLEAIRLVRQLTGASLAQAKDYVETLAAAPP